MPDPSLELDELGCFSGNRSVKGGTSLWKSLASVSRHKKANESLMYFELFLGAGDVAHVAL